MYWAKSLERKDLENGNVFAHGSVRMNLAQGDLTTFVDPPDAALMFGFRGLEAGDPFEKAFAVWMATLRRRGGNDAVVESLQRIFPALADDKSLEKLLQEIVSHARSLGYEKVWFTPALFQEPLFTPALKVTSDALGKPVAVVPSSGMAALDVGAPPVAIASAEECRQRAWARLAAEQQKADALRNERYWDHGRGNVQVWVSIAYGVAMQWVQAVAPGPGEPAQAYLQRVAGHVHQARGKGPPEDDEGWFNGATDEAARIVSGAAT